MVGEAALRFRPAVAADYEAGLTQAVLGTPTLFIGAQQHTGRVDLRALQSAVDLAAHRPIHT